jgi:hypothetical protein
VLSTVASSETAGRVGEEALINGFVAAFAGAAALMVVTSIVAMAMFRDEGRGQTVDVTAPQRAELDS